MVKKNEPTDNKMAVEIEQLAEQLQQAQDRERRAVADYQNLVRRSQDEKIKVAKLAALDLVETILEPLSHLSLAAQQLNDQGLNMVIGQLWQRLNDAGLEEMNPLGQAFDVTTMEAVADPGQTQGADQMPKDNSAKVTKVVAKGYKLNGEIIRHAKVIVG